MGQTVRSWPRTGFQTLQKGRFESTHKHPAGRPNRDRQKRRTKSRDVTGKTGQAEQLSDADAAVGDVGVKPPHHFLPFLLGER